MTTINPYLTFNGTCEKAFNLYKSVFGGDFNRYSKFKDMPENPKYPVSEEDKEKIMHGSLPISDETVLMGSDTSQDFGHTADAGTNFCISINADSTEETTRIFDELSVDGKVTMPLDKTFWGSYFGMLTDKYGIHWMVSCELNEDK